MTRQIHFRKMLPVLQTAVAVAFGGWVLWLRNSILNRPFLGSTMGWNSTAAFHVWPWPFRFAAIVNMPSFLAGGLLAWPLGSVRPGLPEWVSTLPVLLLVPLLWYLVGAWVDRNLRIEEVISRQRGAWLFSFAIFSRLRCGVYSFGICRKLHKLAFVWACHLLVVGLAIKASPLWSDSKSNRV